MFICTYQQTNESVWFRETNVTPESGLTRIDGFSESGNEDTMMYMYNSFVNRKTFSCPKIKGDFITGTDTSDLSPEDISVIAAMGDSLAVCSFDYLLSFFKLCQKIPPSIFS